MSSNAGRSLRSGSERVSTVPLASDQPLRAPQHDPARAVAARAAGRAEIGKVETITELARGRSSARTEVLTRVATGAEEPGDVGTAAVVELGHQDSPAARDALTAAVRSGDPAVARRAAEALGWVA